MAGRSTIRRLEQKLDRAREKFEAERDRRYTEVKDAEEKAIRIKETADRDALGLAREIQTYKDEKANELREQINSERGLYASKSDLTAAMEKVGAELKPIADYIASDRGRGAGWDDGWKVLLGAIAILGALIGWGVFRSTPSSAAPQVIYVPAPPGSMLPTTPPQPTPR